MKIMMADGKQVSTVGEIPTYIVTSTSEQDKGGKKGGITKKHVLIAVSAVMIVVVMMVAILVGMHMFSQAQKEIVKFSMQFKGSNDDDIKQDVESDPNDNVVMYHLSKAGQDAYLVNDFNKGIQIVKMAMNGGVSCYVSALNRTYAMDPGHIAGPDSMGDNGRKADETYMVSNEPVVDRTFLTQKALDMCKGVSVYWVTRHCGQKVADNSTAVSGDRTKRAVYNMPDYNGLKGVGGCCWGIWACGVAIVEYVQGTTHLCQYYYVTGNCCTPSSVYPLGVAYPYCQNVYRARWNTPGLIC